MRKGDRGSASEEHCRDPTARYLHKYVCAEHELERLKESYERGPVIVWNYVDAK